jgi:hypothetical protein
MMAHHEKFGKLLLTSDTIEEIKAMIHASYHTKTTLALCSIRVKRGWGSTNHGDRSRGKRKWVANDVADTELGPGATTVTTAKLGVHLAQRWRMERSVRWH